MPFCPVNCVTREKKKTIKMPVLKNPGNRDIFFVSKRSENWTAHKKIYIKVCQMARDSWIKNSCFYVPSDHLWKGKKKQWPIPRIPFFFSGHSKIMFLSFQMALNCAKLQTTKLLIKDTLKKNLICAKKLKKIFFIPRFRPALNVLGL